MSGERKVKSVQPWCKESRLYGSKRLGAGFESDACGVCLVLCSWPSLIEFLLKSLDAQMTAATPAAKQGPSTHRWSPHLAKTGLGKPQKDRPCQPSVAGTTADNHSFGSSD